jgi:hypothetical protein
VWCNVPYIADHGSCIHRLTSSPAPFNTVYCITDTIQCCLLHRRHRSTLSTSSLTLFNVIHILIGTDKCHSLHRRHHLASSIIPPTLFTAVYVLANTVQCCLCPRQHRYTPSTILPVLFHNRDLLPSPMPPPPIDVYIRSTRLGHGLMICRYHTHNC